MSIRLFRRARASADSISSFPTKRRIRKARPPRVIERLEPRMLLSGYVNFARAVDYPIENSAGGLISADFNGDGKSDLALVNSTGVTVFLSNGRGSFTRADYAAAGSTFAAADFNGDGAIDIAWAGSAPSPPTPAAGFHANPSAAPAAESAAPGAPVPTPTMRAALADSTPPNPMLGVLLNNGKGKFVPGPQMDITGAYGPLIAADFNGDGKIDLALQEATFTINLPIPAAAPPSYTVNSWIALFLNREDASFSPGATYPVKAQYYPMTAADFNGDHRADLALVDNSANGFATVGIMLGNPDGTLAPAVQYSTGLSDSLGLVAADFNNDGKTDLAATTFTEKITSTSVISVVSVLLNSGGANFGPPKMTRVPGYFYSPTAADVNGDGKTDLISGLEVLLGSGNGTFARTLHYSIPLPALVSDVVVGDFNGDRKPDLAAITSLQRKLYISVLFQAKNRAPTGVSLSPSALRNNQPPGTLAGTFSTADPDAGTDFTYSLVPGRGSGDNALFKIDGNQLKTAVPLDAGSKTSYSIRVRSTDGGGLYTERRFVVHITPPLFGLPSVYPAAAPPLTMATADFNGDGKPDLATANPYARSGASTITILLNDGDGTFAPAADYPLAAIPRSMTSADFNSDGKSDLAIVDENNAVTILLGNGNGTFAFKGTQIVSDRLALASTVLAADFNSDGKIDLAVATLGTGVPRSLSLLLGIGDGTFNAPRYSDEGTGVAIAARDFNGDGKIDIAGETARAIRIYPGNGDGTFAAPVDSPVSSDPLYPPAITSSDFNGDGSPDIAVLGGPFSASGGMLNVMLNNGDGTFRRAAVYAISNAVEVAAADFNGDGKPDLAVLDNSGSMTLMLGNGDGAFQRENEAEQGYGSLTPADFNGDGRVDLALRAAGGVEVLLSGRSAQRVRVSLLSNAHSQILQSGARTAVNFGAVRGGQAGVIRSFKATNLGAASLTLGSIQLPTGFKLLQDLPRTLAPRASAVFRVQFVGTSPGVYHGKLSFTTSDPLRNPFVIPLYARRLK